jgi:hypothetical protein
MKLLLVNAQLKAARSLRSQSVFRAFPDWILANGWHHWTTCANRHDRQAASLVLGAACAQQAQIDKSRRFEHL